MMFKHLATAALIAASTPTFASAYPVTASDPQSIMAYFKELGAAATLTEDNTGDPLIELQYYGTKFAVFFYGCRDGKNCSSIQFYSSYTADHEISLAGLNTWNAEQRYGRVYQADDGAKRLEFDIYTGQDGVSSDDFDEIFDIWTQLVKDFEDAMS